jgi:hypothetical protein
VRRLFLTTSVRGIFLGFFWNFLEFFSERLLRRLRRRAREASLGKTRIARWEDMFFYNLTRLEALACSRARRR